MFAKIGLHAPSDIGEEVAFYFGEDSGMEYAVHESEDGLIVAASHEDVGLVTYFRADTMETVEETIFR